MMMMMMIIMIMMILLLTESVPVSYQSNSTVQCERPENRRTVRVRAGESLYLPCPNTNCYEDTEDTPYDWLKTLKGRQTEPIGTEESERVHYNQSTLYILWLTLDDTGCYITRWWYEEDKCDEYETEIVVYEAFHTDLLYITPSEEKASAIYCPVCETQPAATFIWYKNFNLIPNQEFKHVLRIRNSSKESEGIYTCVCTWEHNGLKHNTSGSRRLTIIGQSTNNPPEFQLPVNNSIVITDVGTELILVCSVFFVCDECPVRWERNESALIEDGYKQQNRIKDGNVQSLLNITKVSELDLRSEFRCTTEDSYKVIFVSITLKSRASVLPVILECICIFLLILVLCGILKWFSLDLMLFLRGIFIKFNRKEDGKLYDAYVIYQRNNFDETTSETVSDFISGSLLTVLESYYGFKLFIHGRDDLPGEGTSSISPGAYDLQVGLHQALVQGETGVILIQLGQMRDYTHLPLGLQHLLCRNNPLLWRDSQSSPTSRFWKRVRYRMPVASSRQRRSLKKRPLECKSLPV